MMKIVLTLSVTKVQCERTFNILKYIKNHLRNRLSDDHVLMYLMNGIKDLLMVIDNEVVIKEICKGNPEFSKNLIKSNLNKDVILHRHCIFCFLPFF